jgi:predicted RNA binding protein YcfA (HicA-like mRNA interferase family)
MGKGTVEESRAVARADAAASDGAELRQVDHCPECHLPMIRRPSLHCSKCKEPHYLRCFAYPTRGGFVAECIDLDLLSQGATVEEAVGKLQEAMFSYLDVAFDGDAKGLVLRKAPLSHRLRYHLHRWVPRILAKLHAGRASFVLVPPDRSHQHLSHC